MARNHAMMELTNPWTLEAQQDYTRVNGDPGSVRAVRASGNHLLKFLRKAFTEPDGKSMVKWVEITGFESFCFPGFKYDVRGGQTGGWDLETPRMSHFNWREYLATFPSSELEEILKVPIFDVLVSHTTPVGDNPICNGAKHGFVLTSATHAGKYFLVFLRADESEVICYPDGRGDKGKTFNKCEWTIYDPKDPSRCKHFNQANQTKLVNVDPTKGCEFLFGGWRDSRFKNFLVDTEYYESIQDYIVWDTENVDEVEIVMLKHGILWTPLGAFPEGPPYGDAQGDRSRQRQESPSRQEARELNEAGGQEEAPVRQEGRGSQEAPGQQGAPGLQDARVTQEAPGQQGAPGLHDARGTGNWVGKSEYGGWWSAGYGGWCSAGVGDRSYQHTWGEWRNPQDGTLSRMRRRQWRNGHSDWFRIHARED